MQHYYHDGQAEFGPMDRDTFKSLINDGVIQDQTLVFREDMEDWLSFSAFKSAVKAKKKPRTSASSAGAKAAASVAKRRQQERLEEEEISVGGGSSGSIVGGILMMVGAVVWFVVGYMAGYIYFYPPVLFVLGLVSTIKGCFQK